MDRGEYQPKLAPQEEKMVFEEVGEDESDIVFEEDPVETAAREIIRLEDAVEDAKFARDNGKGSERNVRERNVRVQEVLLAKARYEQARQNERAGTGKTGEADRLLADWQRAQSALEGLRQENLEDTRKHLDRLYGGDVGADTAAQLRRHP